MEEKLTPAVRKMIKKELESVWVEARVFAIDTAILFLRLNRVDAAHSLLSDVSTPSNTLNSLLNDVWSKFVRLDLNREEFIKESIKERKLEPKEDPFTVYDKSDSESSDKPAKSDFLFPFVEGEASASIVYVASSIRKAILEHNVVPSKSTMASIVLLTLRMIPADLKSLRQDILKKKNSNEAVMKAKLEIDQGDTSYSDLAPPDDGGLLPTLKSVYDKAEPAPRRILPYDQSHHIVRQTLGPIWDLLKTLEDDLSLDNLTTLLRGFNKATLVTPTLHLLPQVARHARGDTKLATSAYTYALKTLIDDIRYDDVYNVYTQHLRPADESHIAWTFVLKSPELLNLLLQGISRSPLTPSNIRDQLFELTFKAKALTGDSLRSYTYAASRDVNISVRDLELILRKCRSLNFQKHELNYMNDIFFGMQARGAFNVALEVLNDMWTAGATIYGNTTRLFLDRAIYARQPDIVEGILGIMRPPKPVSLTFERNEHKVSTTSSINLPVNLEITPLSYNALFELDIYMNDVKAFLRHIADYKNVGLRLDISLLHHLLAYTAQQFGRSSFVEPIFSCFKKGKVRLDITAINHALCIYNRARDYKATIELFGKINTVHGLVPNESSFAHLATAYAHSDNLDRALDVISDMRAVNVSVTAEFFEHLIEAVAPTSLERAEWLLNYMQSKSIKVTPGVLKPLFSKYAATGNAVMFKQHLDYLLDMSNLRLDTRFASSLIDSVSILGDFEMLQKRVLSALRLQHFNMDHNVLGHLVIAYLRLGKTDIAHKTILDLSTLPNLGSQSKLANLVFLPALRYLAMNSLAQTWNMLYTMEKKCGVPAGQNIYLAIIEGAAASDDPTARNYALEFIRGHLHPTEYVSLIQTVRRSSIMSEKHS